jgi:predicted GNAT family acetyltransferase
MITATYANAHDFLQTAQTFLETDEATNNLLLGICFHLARAPERIKTMPYFATVSENDKLLLAAVVTPPHNLVIYGHNDTPQPAIRTLAERLLAAQIMPPGVAGPVEIARAFAQTWADVSGIKQRPGMRQRIYELRRVIPPASPPGRLQLATPAETDLITGWALAFQAEAHAPRGDPTQTREAIAYRLEQQEVYLWVDGQPVSMAAKSRPVTHGITVSLVYTPPEFRRRGYASAAVAALSQLLLDSGWLFCTLFTDLANPTSNHIYQTIGYTPVCDFNEYVFDW